MAELRVRTLRPQALDAAHRALWAEYLRAAPQSHSPFMQWEFAAAVADVRPDLRVAVAEDSAGVLAFLSWQGRTRGVARPVAAPFSDVHGPAVRPGATLNLPEMLRLLRLPAYSYMGLPVDAPVTGAGVSFARMPLWVADIGDDGEAYMAARRTLHPSRFRGYAKRMRRAQREAGPVTVTLDDSDPAAFERILTLKRQQFRDTGKHDVLGPEWTRAMLARLRDGDAPDFGLRVSTLRIDGALAAGQINLLGGGTLHSWIVAHDRAMGDYTPGALLMDALIAGAGGLGTARVALGAHHDAYKRLFAEPAGEVAEGVACAAGLVGAAPRLSSRLWRAAESAPLRPVAAIAGKLRRRGGQIAAAEVDFAGRAGGVLNALSGLRPRNPNGG